MFALDNLVRSGVQAAITVLSPELGENLANHSSPSTVNSAKSTKSTESFDLRDQVVQFRSENGRLLHELLESQKQYQVLVGVGVVSRRGLTVLLKVKQLIESLQHQSEAIKEICSRRECQIKDEFDEDPRLASWLQGLGVNEYCRRKILAEGYTLDEVLYNIAREDLQRIGLRGAVEFRIWRAIEQHRQSTTVYLCNGLSDETSTV